MVGRAMTANTTPATAMPPPSHAATFLAWVGSMPATTAPTKGRAREAISSSECDILIQCQVTGPIRAAGSSLPFLDHTLPRALETARGDHSVQIRSGTPNLN